MQYAKSRRLWVIYLIRFDAPDHSSAAEVDVQPRIQAELVELCDTSDPAELLRDIEIAAFLRGGRAIALLEPGEEERIPETLATLQRALSVP